VNGNVHDAPSVKNWRAFSASPCCRTIDPRFVSVPSGVVALEHGTVGLHGGLAPAEILERTGAFEQGIRIVGRTFKPPFDLGEFARVAVASRGNPHRPLPSIRNVEITGREGFR